MAGLSPTEDELAWARERTRTDEHLLDLVTALKCCQRLGYFPRPDDAPAPVLDHLRRCLERVDVSSTAFIRRWWHLQCAAEPGYPYVRFIDILSR